MKVRKIELNNDKTKKETKNIEKQPEKSEKKCESEGVFVFEKKIGREKLRQRRSKIGREDKCKIQRNY